VQYSRHMGFRFAKSMLGLMVMALAFSTMAPANAVTPGQVCVRTASGVGYSTTVQWEYSGNSSRIITTDADGCALFPHLPQAEILIKAGGYKFQSGQVWVSHTGFEEYVTVDSSGYVLFQITTNPPEVKYTSINFRTNANKAVIPEMNFALRHRHPTDTNPEEDDYTEGGSWTSYNNWSIWRTCTNDEGIPSSCNPIWMDTNGTYHFYYFGELARDFRDLTRYDPDTDQTLTLPANPVPPFVNFLWKDSQFGQREVSYFLAESSQTVTLLQAPSIKRVPNKPLKFKSGKPVKVTLTLLDSYGNPWKNQWVGAFPGYYEMKKSKKCKLKNYAKTNSKGVVTLTLCPKYSDDFYLEAQQKVAGDWLSHELPGFSVKKTK
jgi:hypothetical protein